MHLSLPNLHFSHQATKPPPAITKYFLENKDPVDAQYTINTDDFVRWVLEQQNINMANYIMVNSSDWDQVGLDSSGSEKRAKALVNTLMKNGLFWKNAVADGNLIQKHA